MVKVLCKVQRMRELMVSLCIVFAVRIRHEGHAGNGNLPAGWAPLGMHGLQWIVFGAHARVAHRDRRRIEIAERDIVHCDWSPWEGNVD